MQKVVSINFFDLFLNGVQKFLEQLFEFTHLMRRYHLLSERPDFYEGILTLSNLKNSEPLELKAVYDKLLLFSRFDWNRIIDLASQRNIFDNLELANLKNVSSSLIRKEQVKERSLISAYESIKKLRKYGIEI